MPSHRHLDDITKQYFATVSPEQFDRDRAEASPPVPPEATDRPPVRGPRAPAQRGRQRFQFGETPGVRFQHLERKLEHLQEVLTSLKPPPRQQQELATTIKAVRDTLDRITGVVLAPQINILGTIESSEKAGLNNQPTM
jgi:hypothetical protein